MQLMGFDKHRRDPLGGLNRRLAKGRIVTIPGGGYGLEDLACAMPRMPRR